jgi:hypothetical protein
VHKPGPSFMIAIGMPSRFAHGPVRDDEDHLDHEREPQDEGESEWDFFDQIYAGLREGDHDAIRFVWSWGEALLKMARAAQRGDDDELVRWHARGRANLDDAAGGDEGDRR